MTIKTTLSTKGNMLLVDFNTRIPCFQVICVSNDMEKLKEYGYEGDFPVKGEILTPVELFTLKTIDEVTKGVIVEEMPYLRFQEIKMFGPAELEHEEMGYLAYNFRPFPFSIN